jgi:hypothetical protein
MNQPKPARFYKHVRSAIIWNLRRFSNTILQTLLILHLHATYPEYLNLIKLP